MPKQKREHKRGALRPESISDYQRGGDVERLRNAEERLRVTLSSIGDGVIATDIQGHVTFVNPVAERLTGWPQSDACGKPLNVVFNIINELSRRPVTNPVAKVLRDGNIVGLANHTVLIARDGTERPIADSAAPIRNLGGELSGVVLVFRDVTESRAAEIAAARLAAIVDNSDDAIVGKDLHGIIRSWNKGAQRIFGYTPEEVIGKSVTILMPPERQQEEQQILARLLRGETVDHFETVRVTKDGRLIDISVTISPIRDAAGEIVGASKIARDITVQRQADEARLRLGAIVESSDDAIVSKTLDGIIQSWNKGAERIFGYSAREVIGKHITLLIPPERHNEEVEILARLRRGERSEHYRTMRVRKNGQQFHASITISPIRNSAGEIIGASKILRDVTPQIQAQEALQEAQARLQEQATELELRVQERTAQLQETIAELEAFSYTVSHDLRAPLRAMQQYAQVLIDDHTAQLDAQGKLLLSRIVAASQRLDTLIRDVLTYSGVLRTAVRLEPVNIEKLVSDIIEHYPALQAPNADIEVRGPLLSALGNEAFMTQAISNLLTNAVKFVSKNIKPRIQVWTEALNSPSQPGGRMVRLWIQDNGIGIAPEHQDRIFGMFERLHSGSEFEGTGIGLAIVRKAVERMGGSVGVHSQPGKGSKFWIDLRAAA